MDIPNIDFSRFDDPSKQRREQCGIIMQSDPPGKPRYDLVRVQNTHPRPRTNWIIRQRHLDDVAIFSGWHVFAYVHTHTAVRGHMPTKHDIESLPPGILGVVYHPIRGSAVWYTHKGVLRRGYRQTR